MNKDIINELSKEYDSFYLYEEDKLLSQIHALQHAFPSVEFLYSVKCNPNENILKTVFENGMGSDSASLNEVLKSKKYGCSEETIYFSCPGKTRKDIEQAIDHSVIIADSIHEIERIKEVAKASKKKVKIGIRINPSFTLEKEAMIPSKFGIDEDQVFHHLKENTDDTVLITGIHIHVRSQELDATKLETYYKHIMDLTDRLQKECNIHLEYINMGSGIGIPYALEDTPLDIETLGANTEKEIKEFKEKYPNIKFIIETGRYIVGESGSYITKVLDKKVSCGKTYVIVKNTLNGFLRLPIALLFEKYAGMKNTFASEPLYSKANAHTIIPLKEGEEKETVSIVGNLCTAADMIADNIELPKLEIGDILFVTNAGAYASVLSPMQFSSQEKPAEIFLKENGEVII